MRVLPVQLIALFGIMQIFGTDAGFPGIFCASPGENKTLSSCEGDCRVGHNAEFGKCGHQNNCYCSFPLSTVNGKSIQCLNPTVSKWDEICTFDCQCNHGALGGECDYRTRGCTCIGNALVFGKELCPFASAKELLVYFKTTYDALGMSDFANIVLSGASSGSGS